MLRDRLLAALTAHPGPEEPREPLAAVLLAWLTFVRVLCVDWLDSGAPDRGLVRTVCTDTLFAALAPWLDRRP